MDNSKATTGGEGLLKHDQNSSTPEILKPNVGNDAAEHLAKPSTWAQITNENSHLLPTLPKDDNRQQDKLPYLELLYYEIAAQHLINAIANSSKQLTGQELFHQPGPNLARLFKHLGESNEQLKSFENDKEIKPAALNPAVSEIKTGSAQSTAPNPFLLFSQVSLKENAVVDGAGKKTVSEPLVVKASTAETTQLDQSGLVKAERTTAGSAAGAGESVLPEVTLGPLTVSKAHLIGSPGSDSPAPVIANPTLVAAPKSDSQTVASSTPGARAENTPVLVAATKLESPVSVTANPTLRAETAPVLVAATKLESQTPVAPTAGVKAEAVPTLVAATKLESQTPVAPTAGAKAEAVPTLVAATKLESQAPVAPTLTASVEVAPVLVAAAKVDPVIALNHGEVTLSKTNPASQAMTSATRVEPGSVQQVSVNPFMAIKQVAVRDEAVVDGSGKVVVNEPVVNYLPAVAARVAPESSTATALTANSHTDKALSVNFHATTPLTATATNVARLAGDNGDSSSRPPVIVASQLVVKDPVSRNEVSTPAQPALVQAPAIENQAPANAPTSRLDNPVLVAATKLESQSPVAQSPTSRLDNPVLMAATKLESQTNSAQANTTQPAAARLESAPVLVAAAKAEPDSTQSAVANPFQSIKQVAVRNEAVLDSSGKVENNDLSNRPPVILASQLVVKDPVIRNEASKTAQPAVLQNSGVESTAPTQAPASRLDNPVMVAATKVESPTPSINPTVRGDNAPVLVAATRIEPVANPVNRGEVTLSPPRPAAQAAVGEAKVEPASTQPLSTNPLPANPFQSIKQVAVREEAVVESSGKVVLNESVASQASVVSARLASENPNPASSVNAATPFVVSPSAANSGSISLARSIVDSGSNSRPPVIAANQLVVKDPALRSETVSPGQIVVPGSKPDAALPVVRVVGSDSVPTSGNPVVQDRPKPQSVAANPFTDYTNVLAKSDGVSDSSGKKVIAESVTQSVPSTEAPKPQPAAPNPFEGYTNVLAKMDSVIDNSGKRVIAENVTQNIQSTITPKSLPLSPANEVAVVRNANSDSREAVLARNSAPVVMASQLAVKDAGGQNKTEGQARNESPVRAEVLVKAEPVARVEPVIKLTENIKGSVPLVPTQSVSRSDAASVPAQTGSKSDVSSVPAQTGSKSDVSSVPAQTGSKSEVSNVPAQSINKSDASGVPAQSGNKAEGSLSSSPVGNSAAAASIAAVATAKIADKQNGAETLAATNTLEGLFEVVGRSRALASGDILTAKTSASIEPTPLKTAAEAKVVADNAMPGAKSVTYVSMPVGRANNSEFQIVDPRAGLTIASADAALTGSVLSPALQNGLATAAQTVKTEGTAVKTEGQNAALDIKTPVRPGLKEGEGLATAGAAIVTATSRSNAGGGSSTAPSSKSGVTASGATPSGTTSSGVASSGVATSGAATSGATTPGTTIPGTATSGATTSGTTTPGTTISGTTTPGTATAGTAIGNANAGGAATGTGASAGLVGGHGGGSGIAGTTGTTGAAAGTAPVGVSGASGAAVTDPITASSNQSGLTIDPKALQPLTLVDGEEVLDGSHKGETLTTRGPGKKNKSDETTKEPESDRAGAAKTHANGNVKNGKGRAQSADDETLTLAELERQKRAEAEKRRKLQEKARKHKAEQPRQVEKQRRCHILKGDTLESLALQYLGASNLATLIYKINQGFWWERRHANKIYLELLTGTVIFLPTTGEIAQFRDKLSCGKVKLLQFEYLSCEHVRSLRQLLAGARDKKAVIDQGASLEQQCETIAQEEVTANLTESTAQTVAVAPVAGTYIAFAANCDKKPTPLAASFAATQTGRLLIPGQMVVADRLEEQSRVVELHNPQQSGIEHCQVQLQVWHSGQWLVVMEYVSSDDPVLNVHSLSGTKREIKMLLPASAVKSMALHDLTKNRLEYARRFLLGRKILV
ncbi:MAG: hypothetical protein KA255_04210 [Candidatus Obscuribacter sp.]|nr:hypothetical protein [Candidatus Obscuribacter sp.]